MKRRTRALSLSVVLLALYHDISSCTDSDLAGRILSVESAGAITGLVYLDHNGNEVQDASDDRVEGLEIQFLVAGTQSLAASATTDANGVFVVGNLPVGRFRLEADSTFLGDSLAVFDFDDAELTLRAGDTLSVVMGVTFPSFTLAEARNLPVGTKGFTQGIVLNPGSAFADGSLYLQAGETYLRIVGTPPTTLLPGDGVRIFGRAAQEAGQPILREGEPFLLAQQVVLPQPLELNTGTAATANGGLRDAALVRIRDANIVDTATVIGPFGRDLLMTVDDGSGPLDMMLLQLGGFDLGRVHPDSFSIREAIGVLRPSQTSGGLVLWRLIPRSSTDLAVDPIPFPGQVIDLTVVQATSTTLTLNWTEVDDGFGSPSGYTARFRPSTTLVWTEITSGECGAPIAGATVGEVLVCTADGLQAGTFYFFEVRPFRGTLGVDAQFGPRSNSPGETTDP